MDGVPSNKWETQEENGVGEGNLLALKLSKVCVADINCVRQQPICGMQVLLLLQQPLQSLLQLVQPPIVMGHFGFLALPEFLLSHTAAITSIQRSDVHLSSPVPSRKASNRFT